MPYKAPGTAFKKYTKKGMQSIKKKTKKLPTNKFTFLKTVQVRFS